MKHNQCQSPQNINLMKVENKNRIDYFHVEWPVPNTTVNQHIRKTAILKIGLDHAYKI